MDTLESRQKVVNRKEEIAGRKMDTQKLKVPEAVEEKGEQTGEKKAIH